MIRHSDFEDFEMALFWKELPCHHVPSPLMTVRIPTLQVTRMKHEEFTRYIHE